MTDPAREAAKRAWDAANVDGRITPFEHLPTGNTFVRIQVAAAREALAPIRAKYESLLALAGEFPFEPGEPDPLLLVLAEFAPLIYSTEELENPNV